MTYRELFLKTQAQTDQPLVRGALGLCEEAGEVSGIIKKHLFQGHELDRDKLIKELGDVRWYFEALCVALETTIEEVEEKNMKKLSKRFPNGFTTEDSQARIDEELADLNNQTYKALKYHKDHGLDSHEEAIRIQQEGMTNSIAGRIGVIGELLGGQPIYDSEGEKIGVTEAIITAEEARKLAGFDSSFVPMNFKDKKLEDWEF